MGVNKNVVVIYFEIPKAKLAKQMFRKITNGANPPIASFGGASQAGCSINIQDGTEFHAIELIGDTNGWVKDLETTAEYEGIRLGKISGTRLVVSGGDSFEIENNQVKFISSAASQSSASLTTSSDPPKAAASARVLVLGAAEERHADQPKLFQAFILAQISRGKRRLPWQASLGGSAPSARCFSRAGRIFRLWGRPQCRPCHPSPQTRRNRIEILFDRLKDWRRVVSCYERCPKVFPSAEAHAAPVMVWL